MRKLASIQKITSVSPIEGADKIELCNVLGWQCVIAKRDNFKIGDLVVYVEIDSLMPERPEYEFLRERKFRVRTIKLRGNISQGLILPLSVLPHTLQIAEDMDVTEILDIKNYVKGQENQEESVLQVPTHRSPVMQYLMKFKLARSIYFTFNSVDKSEWPSFAASKTDEERIQTCAKILMANYDRTWYIAEKLDGQSGTFFTYYKRVWGIKRKTFGVCSRNIWLKTKHSCNYWKIAEKYDLEKKLKALPYNYTIQGEIVGPGIQKNKYNLTELDCFVFNVYVDGVMLSPVDMAIFCSTIGMKTVPILTAEFRPNINIPNKPDVIDASGALNVSGVVNYLVNMSEGNSVLLPRKREGIVMRLVDDPRISFKVINPQFLLESGE